MPRLARAVIPGVPHHVTQRGNRRQQTFFDVSDYELYCRLMAQWCARCGVEIWAYCLMPNHAHLIARPLTDDALRRAVGEAHRRYTLHVNEREGWRGHLWQGRFASYPMDDGYLLAAARYVELNPVRAGLVATPGEYPWSSAVAHLKGRPDPLIQGDVLPTLVRDWQDFLMAPWPAEQWEKLRRHERTGRPIGSEEFVTNLERQLGRPLRPRRRGPRPRKPHHPGDCS